MFDYKKYRDDFDIKRAVESKELEVLDMSFEDIEVEDLKHGEIKIINSDNDVALVFRAGDKIYKLPVSGNENSYSYKPVISYVTGIPNMSTVVLDNQIFNQLVSGDLIYYDGSKFNKIQIKDIIPKGIKKVAKFYIDYSNSIYYIISDFSSTDLCLMSIDILVSNPFSSGTTFAVIVRPSENMIVDYGEFDITTYGFYHKDFMYFGGEEDVVLILNGTPSIGSMIVLLTYVTETNNEVA